jgi:CRP-like cAMP-binding protein
MSVPYIVRQADIFGGLTDDHLELIWSISRVVECSTGDVIFEKGAASDELYVITNGEVDIQVDPALIGEAGESRPITITTLRRGESFG